MDYLIDGLVVFDTIVYAYTFYLLFLLPKWKFRKTKRRGYYIDVHKYDQRGNYGGSITNLSLDDTLSYAGRKIFGVMPKHRSLNQRIEDKMDNAMDRNTDKIIDAMLSNKNVQKQMQKKLFEKLLKSMNAKMGDDDE